MAEPKPLTAEEQADTVTECANMITLGKNQPRHQHLVNVARRELRWHATVLERQAELTRLQGKYDSLADETVAIDLERESLRCTVRQRQARVAELEDALALMDGERGHAEHQRDSMETERDNYREAAVKLWEALKDAVPSGPSDPAWFVWPDAYIARLWELRDATAWIVPPDDAAGEGE